MTTASTTLSAPRQTSTLAARSLALTPAVLAHLGQAALVLFACWDLVSHPGLTVDGHDMTQSFNWESFNRLALSKGYVPWWNPYTLSGVPFLADFQNQLTYPLNLPLRLLPVQSFFTWGIALHVWIAGAGVMALCRVIGTGWLPAFLAGAGFALGGVYAPRIDAGHLMLMYGWAWLPVALAVAIVSLRRSAWLPHPALPVVLTLQFLTGHLQTTIYVDAAVGALFVYAWLAPKSGWSLHALNWRPAAQWGITLTFLTGLAAFMLLPTIVVVKELGRTAGLTYDAAARNSWDLLHVLTLYAPNAMSFIRAEPNDSVTGSHWERSAYCGALLMLLAPLGLMLAREHRRYAAFFGGLAVIVLAFAFGRNLPFFYLHYLILPGLRHASRILPVFSLSMVVLGALGLDALLRRRAPLTRLVLSVVAVEALIIAALTWWLHVDSDAPVDEVLGSAVWLLPLQLAGLVALASLASRRGVSIAVASLLGLCLLTELSVYDAPFIQARSLPDTRIADRLFDRESIDRVVTNCDGVVQPNDMMALGVPTVNGYNSVFFQSYAAITFLTMNNQIPIGTKQVRGITVDSTNPDRMPQRMDLLNMMNVTHVLACDPLQARGFIEVGRRGSVALYRNLDAWPRAVLTCGFEEVADQGEAISRVRDTGLDLRERTVLQGNDQTRPPALLQSVEGCRQGARVDIPVKDRPDGALMAKVAAPKGGILFLSEPYYPERGAWLDGAEVPLYRANVAFTALPLPPGTHTLELRYVPRSFWIGGAITAAAAIGWLVLLALWRRQA